jgi:chromosome partitioning protein
VRHRAYSGAGVERKGEKMQVVTIANLKGGSAKTTSAVFLAHAWVANGKNVLLVDADPQASALRWSEAAQWEIPTVGLPVRDLHTRLAGITPPSTDLVIVDTPPLDDHAGVVYSALRAADAVVITVAPTMMEVDRLADVWAAVAEVEALRSRPAPCAVLLNRTVANASSTGVFRRQIENEGHVVLPTAIPRREAIAQSLGAPVTELGAYAAAALDINDLLLNGE